MAYPISGDRIAALVVDDMEVNLLLVARLLAKHGCEVRTASNGEEALAALAQRPAAIIFMDCQMPGMDGLEATRRIRAGDAGRPAVIIALTAGETEEHRTQCLAAGMNDYLGKPVTAAHIARILDKWLGPGTAT